MSLQPCKDAALCQRLAKANADRVEMRKALTAAQATQSAQRSQIRELERELAVLRQRMKAAQ